MYTRIGGAPFALGRETLGETMNTWAGLTAPACPLCGADKPTAYHRDRLRSYWRCQDCTLVFVPPAARVNAAAEKARYDQHRNDPADPRYRQFLSRLTDPLVARVPRGAVGLDFGSGPGPALGPMLAEAGLIVHTYDVFYAPDQTVWSRRYDFITATEVIEHLYHPLTELDRLFSALVPGGYLAIMTRWVGDHGTFACSRYIRDPTHVCFYNAATCRWIARRWRASLELPRTDVALFRTGAATLADQGEHGAPYRDPH